ncbi:MAG: putative DNA modification/repair radical SAM protein [Clostridiales bacterium]|jgi:putative DNA modification/repair radical SAM protein|nr:putative DNA modification/repair radical SAM protein [Clostridiales bacterium]
MIIQEGMSIQRKLEILSDAAKFDVACTSSGVDRKGNGSGIGNSLACGICHTFSADGRCISLLKILFTNECIFDCKYCINRSSNDVVRASFTPTEVCELTMEFYRRNYIEGLFLSSGIMVSPNHTMELIFEALRMLREEYHFNGYIHCKAIPGTDPVLVEAIGWYADRMSVNLELPTASSLKQLAPHKSRKNILKPIRQIQLRRENNNEYLGIYDGRQNERNQVKNLILRDSNSGSNNSIYNKILNSYNSKLNQASEYNSVRLDNELNVASPESTNVIPFSKSPKGRSRYVPAGQSTQMIIGATNESDYHIMSVSETLYDNFDLKRVFYSAFVNVNNDSNLPSTVSGPPLLREHRLYQADWLLRFYGFKIAELLTEKNPNFNVLLDPKCDWALRHLEIFPVEVNKADYYTLLRVPGIGVNSARRITTARKTAVLDFKDLKAMGIVLKRAVYFITCGGKMMYPIKLNEDFITRELLSVKDRLPFGIEKDITYKQLSLFDDVSFKPDDRLVHQQISLA